MNPVAKEVDDPDDSKPADWVDEKEMKDPAASKPEDWDEEAPETVADEVCENGGLLGGCWGAVGG